MKPLCLYTDDFGASREQWMTGKSSTICSDWLNVLPEKESTDLSEAIQFWKLCKLQSDFFSACLRKKGSKQSIYLN